MAYFANGTEGMMNQEHYCCRCVHWEQRQGEEAPGCPVWDLHFLWNYDAVGEKADKTKHTALETLWPDKGRCKLFHESASAVQGDGCDYLEATREG